MTNNIDQVKKAENEAKILLEYALALSKAAESNDQCEIITVLDANLKLWVEIETTLKTAKSLLPNDIQANLLQLSKFVERLTLSKGIHMSKTDFDCLANINMQIAEGFLAAVKNNLAKEEAFSLLKCALDLSSAKENDDVAELVTALDNNLKLWVYIKTLASAKNTNLPQDTKSNLVKLADYVSSKTLEIGQDVNNVNGKAIDSMIMTNLQISEGLMSMKKAG